MQSGKGFQTDYWTLCRYLSNLQFVLESCLVVEYCACRLQTGVCKPSIFSGLDPSHRLQIPALFPTDLMHLTSLNLTDLMVRLLHGTIDCSTLDSCDSWSFTVFCDSAIWQAHGKVVTAATPYLPSIFDHLPHVEAMKIKEFFHKAGGVYQ